MPAINKKQITNAVKQIIAAIGENPNREGLRETPERIAQMYEELFSGIGEDPREILRKHLTEDMHKEMIILKDIPFYSMCEHHLLPFIGKAHIAYIPHGNIVGLSRLAHAVEIISKKPQIQERLTSEIADTIDSAVKPYGVLVVVECEHLCISMRGTKKPGTTTVTSAIRGYFLKNDATRQEAFSLINKK
ncbi:GTP cyclohydrolase I FolE [Candidatus Woesearchaeota archaeon]|nr:GTP cyclohydrolase I FolE [Candidatus Woesearchaeota archaeon]